MILVVGAEAGRVRAEIDDPRVIVERNPLWRDGLATSIRRGIMAVRDHDRDVEAAVLMACDQPHLAPRVLQKLIEAYRSRADRAATMAACAYGGTVGTPALFARSHFDRLAGLAGDRGAQGLLLECPDAVIRVDWPEGEIDVDRPEDASRRDRRR